MHATPASSAQPGFGTGLLDDCSLEITARDAGDLAGVAALLPLGTRIDLTHLGGEAPGPRVRAARAISQIGCLPVPHIAARRLGSEAELKAFLGELRDVDASASVFVVGGDPPQPQGPYADALSVISSGLLERHGVQEVSIAGYPEGHPNIADALLWDALERKAAALAERGLAGTVVTQFGFDADVVLRWIEASRGRGIELPIRVGVPGPTSARRLFAYARRFGVGSSAGIARKYGLSLTNLASSAGPERFIGALADGYDPQLHGVVRLHFYTFGGLIATAQWLDGLSWQASTG